MQEFVYRYTVTFTLQLVFCLFFFIMNFPKRSYFVSKLVAGTIFYFSIAYGMLHLLQRTKINFIGFDIIYFMLLFFMVLCIIGLLYNVTVKEIIFAGIGGYAVQHIGYGLRNIFAFLFQVQGDFSLMVLPYVAVSFIVYFTVIKKNNNKGELKDKDQRMLTLASVVLFSNIILSLFVDTVNSVGVKGRIIYSLYAMICSALAIYIEFNLSFQNKLQNDYEIMEYLLHMKNEQQKISKENIELINIKCHDLKHQITKLVEFDNKEEQQGFLDEISKQISIYNSIFTTGNEALDLVLTEKSLACENYGITFSCMVDGKSLDFISTPDIYSLFGNAMDNAIEGVLQENNKEKRIISMKAYEHNDMLYIHLDNRCRKIPDFKEGLPLTTKEDDSFHGFGVKSIKHITEKYGGELRLSIKEKQFHLDILFPIQTEVKPKTTN